jgi:hypothetical protein
VVLAGVHSEPPAVPVTLPARCHWGLRAGLRTAVSVVIHQTVAPTANALPGTRVVLHGGDGTELPATKKPSLARRAIAVPA